MNFGFSMVFFAVWPGGRRCANCRDVHFLRGIVMKVSSHEKHSKQQWEKTNKKKTKSSDPWARSGERPGRGHGSELFVFFWGVFPWFFAIWPKPREHKKKEKKQKVQTHGQSLGYPHTNQKTKKTKKTRNQKTKKTKNQKNKKTKNQKKQKKQDCTPQGEGGQMQSVGSCLFVFFVFLFFCFFGFLFFCFYWFFGLCVDSHCRCAKQRLPGTVSGCTRSKVDTLQYSTVCYDIVHSANEQQRGMEFSFVRLRHMLLDLCTGNAAICALPQWPVLYLKGAVLISLH